MEELETKSVRFTVGGNLIHYPDDDSIPSAYLTAVKLLVNFILSTPNEKSRAINIRDST
jgi:hypothetical protein